MRNILLMFSAICAAAVSCGPDELIPQVHYTPEGYVHVQFAISAPDMLTVNTRSVDPDGKGVQNLTLFCFDQYGLFISTVAAAIVKDGQEPSLSGTFSADIPQNTDRIHFLANQNMTSFGEDNFRNKTEQETIAALEGSAGMMIYWARFKTAEGGSIEEELKNTVVTLIRNQARISIRQDESSAYMYDVTGFVAYNINAFGTVAPFSNAPGEGFPSIGQWQSWKPFVTLPVNTWKMSDQMDVVDDDEQFIFESENSVADPVSVIIRAHRVGETDEDDLYYRVMLVDDNGEQVLVRRNFSYVINIKGELSYGQKTFADAISAAATNNVWLSISDEVTSVEDAEFVLTVEQTSVIYDADGIPGDPQRILRYTIERKDGKAVTESDIAEVSWLGDNNVASHSFAHSFNVSGGKGTGEIAINLLPLAESEKQEGTLLVRKGRLQRKIKVIAVKKQMFAPAWVSTQVYGQSLDSEDTKSHVTLMFTVPETCPQELFPMDVLISVEDLDIRNGSGQQLSLVFRGDDGYGENRDDSVFGKKSDFGYKYVYTVEVPGVQRVYFYNILPQSEGTVKSLWLEAEHFTTIEKSISYIASQREINLDLEAFNSSQLPDGYAKEDSFYYILVPQKREYELDFTMTLTEDGRNVNAVTDYAEFFFYSQNLYPPADVPEEYTDCIFDDNLVEVSDYYNMAISGRRFLFYPRREPDDTGIYKMHLHTNCAKSAEVVRLASNETGAASLRYPGTKYASEADGSKGYGYRSVVFEIVNYRPFRFWSRVNGEGSEPAYDKPGAGEWGKWPVEDVTPLTWSYEPSQSVDIELDITSFTGVDNTSVDPFGAAFEIYIDAPMLEIDAARLSACNLNESKLRADTKVAGRFIYTVDKEREEERRYGFSDPLQPDAVSSADRSNERKKLPFRTKDVVSAGDITISSNEDEVVYLSKTFRVSNSSMAGTIVYGAGAPYADVPESAFVSFEKKSNGSRIGSVSVTEDGRYELRLRKEYEFNWYTDALELYYTAPDNVVYHAEISSLAELSAKPDIVMVPAE